MASRAAARSPQPAAVNEQNWEDVVGKAKAAIPESERKKVAPKKKKSNTNWLKLSFLGTCAALFLTGVGVLIGILATQNYDNSQFLPSNFGQHYTSWRAYVQLAGIAYACAAVFLSCWPFLVSASDPNSQKKKLSLQEKFAKVQTPTVAFSVLLLGSVIICGQFSYTWDHDSVDVQVVYGPFSGEVINASLTMNFGLRGVNITLRGIPDHNKRGHVLFNEHYGWAAGEREPWAQGRNGYGKYSGNFNRHYREHIESGVPIVIQELSEYLTLDGERIRFGRDYRIAGYYTWIINWLAFGEWALSALFLLLSILHTDVEGQSDPIERATSERRKFLLRKTGLDFSFLAGACMLWACLNYTLLKPDGFKVPLPGIDGSTVILQPTHGAAFWLFIAFGLMAAVFSIVRNLVTSRPDKRVITGIADQGWFEKLAGSLQLSVRWLIIDIWMLVAMIIIWVALLRCQRKLHPGKSYFQQGNTAWQQVAGKSVYEYSTALPPEAL